MVRLHPQYITDTAGQKLVVLPVIEFDSLMEELDQLDDIKLFDRAMMANEPSILAEEAFKSIDEARKKK